MPLVFFWHFAAGFHRLTFAFFRQCADCKKNTLLPLHLSFLFLKTLFDSNYFWTLVILYPNVFFDTNFLDQSFYEPIIYKTLNPQKNWTKYFWYHIFLDGNIFFNRKCFWTQNFSPHSFKPKLFLGPTFLISELFWTKYFLD